MASPTAATRVFKETLEECMLKQKDLLPQLEVPRIFLHLRDAFYILDGPNTEGIFRVPPTVSELAKLQEMIDKGRYDIFSVTKNIHTTNGLLKLWFRELAEPIVPVSF